MYLFSRDYRFAAISKQTADIPWEAAWHTYQISLRPEDLIFFGGNPLNNIGQIDFRHDPMGSGPTVPINAGSTLYFDNIVLLGSNDAIVAPFITPLLLD